MIAALRARVWEEAAILLLALQFLTRLPVPADRLYTPQRLQAGVRYYPLVGVLVGVIAAAVYLGSLFLWPQPLPALLAMAAAILATGAFHEDGLADAFDGLGGGMTAEAALAIMRDSRIGVYGAIGLMVVLALKAAVLASLAPTIAISGLIAGHGLSRFSIVVAIATSRYARSEGAAKPVAAGVSGAGFAVAVATAGALIGWFWIAAAGAPVLLGLIGLALGHAAMRAMYERKLGGYTGDCLGAVQQISELGFLLGLAAWRSI